MPTPILRIENVSKRYGKKDVLKGVSLTVDKGDSQDPHRSFRSGEEHAPAVHQLSRQTGRGAKDRLDEQEVHYAHKRDLYAYRQKRWE